LTSSGWNCLSDATQMGIILVVVASVLTLGYLYWRFKIKPNLGGAGNGHRTPTSGYWEVTSRDPNRVSITIYREPRPPRDEEAGVSAVRDSGRSKGGNGPTHAGEITTDQAPKQIGCAAAPDIHLVPPPPPPAFWTSAVSSAIPPPPPFGPPVVLDPGPPPAPLQPGTLGFGPAVVPYPPDAPPPYFDYAAPQNIQVQHPRPGQAATAQPPCTPPQPRSSVPPRNCHDEPSEATPDVAKQSPWRRWFSLGTRLPTVGHARTLSDSSSASTRSKSPSPPAPSVSPPSPRHERSHSRPSRNRQPRLPPAGSRQTRRRRTDSPPQSESSFSSSYINTSVEAVFDNQDPHPGYPQQALDFRGLERRTRRDSGRDTHLASSSDIIPLRDFRHPRRPSSRGARRPPSPDMQFPSPEPRRARVSFELPRGSEAVTSTSSSQSPKPPRRSSTRARRSRSDSYESYHDAPRRRSQPRGDREQLSLAGRITGTFYQMRRALRGEE
jgi:hypothetical protein